jgi:alpha-tubulin suppressor-like RCC1 family protein
LIATRVTQTTHAAGVAAGLIWGTGSNSSGELGLGEQVDLTTALALELTDPVIERPTKVAASLHSLALDASGSVWAWGPNDHGELGLGPDAITGASFPQPNQIPGLSDAIAVAAGQDHSLALRADGTVWAWGANDFGQLGDGTTSERPSPVSLKALNDVIAIVAGSLFSLALLADGTVRAWGQNNVGQLGDGTTTDCHTPVSVKGLGHVAAISACGSGGWHSLALKADGTVWAWGLNNHGQLGDGTTTDRHTPVPCPLATAIGIAAGGWHSLVLTVNGTLVAAGRNDSGQLGDGTTDERHYFVDVTVPEGDDPDPNITLTGVVEVAAGNGHSLVRLVDGAVRAFGFGNAGRLGTRSEADHYQPSPVWEASDAADDPIRIGAPATSMIAIAAGGLHSLMIRSEAIVEESHVETAQTLFARASSMPWAWGSADHGQVIGNSSADTNPYAVTFDPYWGPDVSNLPGSAIAADSWHSISAEAGRTWVWGPTGADSTFTDDPRDPRSLAPAFPSDVVAVAAGIGNSVWALTSEGAVWLWDLLGDAGPLQGPEGLLADITAIATGGWHGLVLRSNGTVVAWGQNDHGQLGMGTKDTLWHWPTNLVQRQGSVVAIAAGLRHSLELHSDGTVSAWGANAKGQLGDTTTTDRLSPVLVRHPSGDPLLAKAIAAGGKHSLALGADGTVWAWGWNAQGQLGDGSTTDRTAAVQVKWRSNQPRTPPLREAKAIAGGGYHSLALLADGRAFGWGWNADGQLGDGTFDTRANPDQDAPVQWLSPPDEQGLQHVDALSVTAIAAGEKHSLALSGRPKKS